MLGVFAQQSGECLEAVDQSLGIIEPVNADGERPPTQALPQPPRLRAVFGMRGGLRKPIRIDADWVNDRPNTLAGIGEIAFCPGVHAKDLAHAVKKSLAVNLRVEPDDVIAAH